MHPSIYEGFGLAVWEAIVRQKPVIVSDIPVFKFVPQNQRVSNFLDPEQWVSCVKKLNNNLYNKKTKFYKNFKLEYEIEAIN